MITLIEEVEMEFYYCKAVKEFISEAVGDEITCEDSKPSGDYLQAFEVCLAVRMYQPLDNYMFLVFSNVFLARLTLILLKKNDIDIRGITVSEIKNYFNLIMTPIIAKYIKQIPINPVPLEIGKTCAVSVNIMDTAFMQKLRYCRIGDNLIGMGILNKSRREIVPR